MSKIASEKGYSTPFVCGGASRDKLMGRLDNISDLDITTGDKSVSLLAKETSLRLGKDYKITAKIADDGHSSIFIGGLKIDFSSNFNTPNIDNILKRKGIKAPTDMQREIYSRDFTCNALLMSFDLKTIIDPTSCGIKDIKSKKIVCCLDPSTTLMANKNRVVRAIYLAAKLDFDVDDKIISWIKANPESVRFASEKSLTQKLNKSMDYNPDKTLKLLDKMGLWNYIPISEKLYPYYIKRIKEEKNGQ